MGSSTRPTEAAAEVNWRHFPQFEKIFEPNQLQPFVAGVERTCRALQEVTRSGTKPEADRAHAALAAYGRALQLVKELREVRAVEAGEATSGA
jgi:hypothetical protein